MLTEKGGRNSKIWHKAITRILHQSTVNQPVFTCSLKKVQKFKDVTQSRHSHVVLAVDLWNNDRKVDDEHCQCSPKVFFFNSSANSTYNLPNILLKVGFAAALRASFYFCDRQTYSPTMDPQLVWAVKSVLWPWDHLNQDIHSCIHYHYQCYRL